MPNLAFGIAEIRSLGQPQVSYLWKFRIPIVPLLGSADGLEFSCRSVSIAGHSADVVVVHYQNGTVTYPGMTTRGHQNKLDVTFMVTESHKEYDALRRWRNASGHEVTGSALFTDLIKTVGIVTAFSVTGIPTYRILYNGLWLASLDTIELNQAGGRSSGEAPTEVKCTFAFDWTVV